MTPSTSGPGRTWDEAAAPGAVGLARRFEAAWRDAAGPRPVLDDFLPGAPHDCPGARLALLRADLALRRESGEKVGAEWYRDRYPDLDDETLVALIYEEFCLREEEQGDPDPAEFLARFPAVAARLRRVFDIHGLVGSGSMAGASAPGAPAVAFPEAGQTIAGFHLVEELGRGAFARVFLARERQLADRPVALKVARAGSREPQTLARLQHTHIVPVHSYRTDPATGLHLLCMPYFGRVTLAQVLADPKVRVARFGADLVDALDRLGPDDGPPTGRSAGRAALGRRTYAQALAWWGARMAEALEHAHERGVLHRDVKPSNVLVTADGMPMLLDFNLAREAVRDGADPASALGGTFDYMAPEHLEELADGAPGRVDARSDIYGLGVLLYEALAGARPFLPPPQGALSAAEVLLRAAQERRGGAPRLGDAHPEVPAAFDAVVQRCLEPDPARRYARAADLAADLQAVADDQPLRFAREPLPSRAHRWLRRHRRTLALAAPAVVALALLAASWLRSAWGRAQLHDKIESLVSVGQILLRDGDLDGARLAFETASGIAEGHRGFRDLYRLAREQAGLAAEKKAARGAADALLKAAEPLRFRLAGLGGDPEAAARELQDVLHPFYVLENPDWTRLAELQRLDPPARAGVIAAANDLLFLYALGLQRAGGAGSPRRALELCERALIFAPERGPWLALQARLARRLGTATAPTEAESAVAPSAPACAQWGLLRDSEGRGAEALDWFRRSVRAAPGEAWNHAYLALALDRAGEHGEARHHADVTVALRPRSPWALVTRARVERSQGLRGPAIDDFRDALESLRRHPESGDSALERQILQERAEVDAGPPR